MVYYSQTHDQRAVALTPRTAPKRALTTVALLALPLLLPSVASGQLRVDTTLYASSGSCANCDLSGKRMNGMTLRNANFAGSLFNNSNLSGGKLHGSDLTGAHFRKALLYGVSGEQVIMRGAVFEDATLTDATLTHSTLRQANLHRAELARGRFNDNDFQSANLIGAGLSEADLSRSNFDRARLDNADFTGATLDSGQFTGVRFGFAKLDGASLVGANLSDADLQHVSGLTQAQLDTACGNMNTRLPAGLSLAYCEGVETVSVAHDASRLSTERLQIAEGLDRAIADVELLIVTQSDRGVRSRLQRIHRDLMQSRAALER